MFDVQVREAPAQRVVTEQANLTVDKLDGWIADTLYRHHLAITAAGGTAGHPAIIFHGEVNHDSDGPVEAIVPFEADNPVDAATRVDPARREAFVTITKAQLEFPAVLEAYDAVAAWIVQHGRQVGSPREIYFANAKTASDDDLVCDIAFPIASD